MKIVEKFMKYKKITMIAVATPIVIITVVFTVTPVRNYVLGTKDSGPMPENKQSSKQTEVVAEEAAVEAKEPEKTSDASASTIKKEPQVTSNAKTENPPPVQTFKIKAGDIIGTLGNTGNASGCKLGLFMKDASQNPVDPENYIGNGYFIHPAPGTTVGRKYTGGVDYYGTCGIPVRAAADGDIVAVAQYGYNSGYGNNVVMKHTNGMYSTYAHLRTITVTLSN